MESTEESIDNNRIIDYCCTRCDYKTNHRTKMYNHLYKRKKVCPGTQNDIILTDFIKEKILLNRVYIIPKKIKSVVKKIESTEWRHYLYFLREKENVNHSENVYKIGQNKTKEYLTNVTRLLSYGIGTEVILVLKCNNSLELERLVKIEFNNLFQKYKFGTEYFVGDEKEMISTIFRIYEQYKDTFE